MAQDYGNLPKMDVVSDIVAEELRVKLAPVAHFFDVSEEAMAYGDSVTVHLYQRGTSPASQSVSGGAAIDYSTYNDGSNTLVPVNIILNNYQPDGFDLPENVIARSPAKDLYTKFARARTYELADKITLGITALIDSSYTNTIALSGADFTFETLAKRALPECGNLGILPEEATLVLNWNQYGSLLNSLPSLPGVQVNDAMRKGTLDEVAGFSKIVATNKVPAGTTGYISSRTAIAAAMRPLPLLNQSMSYGTSYMGKDDETGLSVRIREFQDPSNPNLSFAIDTIWGAKQFDTNALIRLV